MPQGKPFCVRNEYVFLGVGEQIEEKEGYG